MVDEDATIRLREEHKAEMDAHWKNKRAFDPAYRERRRIRDRERWIKKREQRISQ